MKGIYKFDANVGSIGNLCGIFVATQGDIKELIETPREVYFGECLVNGSEVTFKIKEEQITHVSSDESAVQMFEYHIMEIGYNPVSYYKIAVEDKLYN